MGCIFFVYMLRRIILPILKIRRNIYEKSSKNDYDGLDILFFLDILKLNRAILLIIISKTFFLNCIH